MPPFAVEDCVERRPWCRNLAAGEGPQYDGVIALLEHRVFRDFLVVWIAEARHELAVLGVGLRLFLLEPVEHHRRIADLLEPRQPALDLFGIGNASGSCMDPFGPPRGVLVFLLRKTHQDVPSLEIGLTLREQFVGLCGFDFPPPHLFDGCQVDAVDRHDYPMNFSNPTMVKMPAAMRRTWRAAFESICPRCRSGIRSDIAM